MTKKLRNVDIKMVKFGGEKDQVGVRWLALEKEWIFETDLRSYAQAMLKLNHWHISFYFRKKYTSCP